LSLLLLWWTRRSGACDGTKTAAADHFLGRLLADNGHSSHGCMLIKSSGIRWDGCRAVSPTSDNALIRSRRGSAIGPTRSAVTRLEWMHECVPYKLPQGSHARPGSCCPAAARSRLPPSVSYVSPWGSMWRGDSHPKISFQSHACTRHGSLGIGIIRMQSSKHREK
jgi:hypothetical protein